MIKKTLKTIFFSGLIVTSGYLFNTDESMIVDGQLIEESNTIETVQESQETITEQFIITSIDNGIVKGEQTNGTGEGIFYNLNELDKKDYDLFSVLDVNDSIMIEWTKENYNNNEWLEMESVVYNKAGASE